MTIMSQLYEGMWNINCQLNSSIELILQFTISLGNERFYTVAVQKC
jgi:hypothetical protein